MHKRGFGWVTRLLLLVMLLSLAPGVASAGSEWKAAGRKVWLTPGKGINLRTGGAGADLVFDGETIAAKGGIQVAADSDFIDWEMTPPQSQYVTSLATSSTVDSRVVVRLAGGGYAQVRLGMASSSGMLYTGLFLEEWVVTEGTEGVEPILRGEVKLKLDSLSAQANGVPAVLDVAPRKVNGQVMVPLRFLGESLGLNLKWDARESKVTITGEGLDMELWVDKREAKLNGEGVALGQSPTLANHRLLIPMLVAAEALAGKATYDSATGAITLGGKALASAHSTDKNAALWPAHFSGIWLNGYENGWISDSATAQPDFYLTLNADGSARVVQTITGIIGAASYPVNLEYQGTYTLNPLRVQLQLQPAIKGWELLEHSMPYWQEMTITGTLAPDMSKIEGLTINERPAKSGSALPAKRVPEPGEWR